MEAHSIDHGHTALGQQTDSSGIHSVKAQLEVETLAASIGLPPGTIVELLRMFVSATWIDLGCIRNGIHTGNLQQVAAAAHSIKGAALSFELHDIASAARQIEMSAHNAAPLDSDEAIDHISLGLLAIERSIDTALRSQS